MMVERVLMNIREWINEGIRLREEVVEVVHKRDMFHYLAVMLSSHTTGLTLDKTVDILKKFGAIVPSVDRVRWIADHVLAYPVVGRTNGGTSQWRSQRDRTPNLA